MSRCCSPTSRLLPSSRNRRLTFVSSVHASLTSESALSHRKKYVYAKGKQWLAGRETCFSKEFPRQSKKVLDKRTKKEYKNFISYMVALFSRASELAIRAAVYLALQPPGKVSPVREIARGTGLPRPYLAKVIRPLIRAGLVRAFRGPGGGIELGRSAETISLRALVRAVEGAVGTSRCILGLGVCSPENPCPLHHQWTMLNGEIEHLLEVTTLGSVAQGLQFGNGLESASTGAGSQRRTAGQRHQQKEA